MDGQHSMVVLNLTFVNNLVSVIMVDQQVSWFFHCFQLKCGHSTHADVKLWTHSSLNLMFCDQPLLNHILKVNICYELYSDKYLI